MSTTVIRTYICMDTRTVDTCHFGTYETGREAVDAVGEDFDNKIIDCVIGCNDVVDYWIDIDEDNHGRVVLKDLVDDDHHTWLILDSDDNDEYFIL